MAGGKKPFRNLVNGDNNALLSLPWSNWAEPASETCAAAESLECRPYTPAPCTPKTIGAESDKTISFGLLLELAEGATGCARRA
jgi:hypothetical protein